MNVTARVTLHPSALKEQREWRPAGLNGLTIRWVWARRRGKARRARATKAAAKVKQAEYGYLMAIMEEYGYQFDFKS